MIGVIVQANAADELAVLEECPRNSPMGRFYELFADWIPDRNEQIAWLDEVVDRRTRASRLACRELRWLTHNLTEEEEV